jgi:thiamine pyrophosphokinase
MTAVIVCNGSVFNYFGYRKYFEKAGLIIAADGGAAHLKRFQSTPHLLVGDLDSITGEDLERYVKRGVEILKFPKNKDMTDTELAVECAIQRGYKNIIFIGAMGTRADHTLSNVFMLKNLMDRGLRGTIVNEYNEITLIKDRIELDREENVKVTLLSLTDRVEGVTTNGLQYPLDNATLHMGSSLGVSNEFADSKAEVTIKSGLLLVIKSRD